MAPLADDDEMTELVDADFPRVDLVGKGANGIPRFLIAKQDADSTGLLEPGFVRDLIAKAEPDSGRERVQMPSGVTLSGSPADIAAFIHKAAQRAAGDDVAKAEMSGKSQNDLPDSDFAYIEPGGKKDEDGKTTPRSLRHFNISDAAHVRNALARASQSPFGDKAMGKIRSAAKKFGIEVSKEAGVPETVAKDAAMGPELDEGVDGMDPTVPLAAPDGDAPGDPTDPGSPAWEAIDAATAQKWTSIAVRLKNALCVLSEREMLEAASADPDDIENAFDLEDAQCAVDYVISTLAVFAAGEQAEADLCGEAMEAIGKAMASFDDAPLTVIEGLCPVAKSGRVLSSANETHIREAAARLNTVLSSLPQAPAPDDGQPVAKEKETAMAGTATGPATVAKDAAPSAEEQARNAGPVNAGGTTGLGQPRQTGPAEALPADGPQAALPGDVPGRQVIKSAGVGVFDHASRFLGLTDSGAIHTDIAKADGGGKKAMCVVYNQAGKLMGIVDPDDITPVANSEAEPDEAPGDGDATPAAPAADASDMTPAPAAETGTPAGAVDPDGAVAKSSDSDVFTALESTIAKAVAAALDGRTPAQDIARQADVAGLLQEVGVLKARLAQVEESPAAPKVFTNGAVPPAHQMRGQDKGATAQQVDVAKAMARKAELYAADGPGQARIAKEMQAEAVDVLAAMHAGR